MKKVGIWIDKREAKIVSIQDGKEQLYAIASDLDNYNATGGSGTKMKGGPQDVVQDSKYLEREKHQLAAFFKAIASYVKGVDSIVIFGPAQTGEKLSHELLKKYSFSNDNIKPIEKADSMTDNQIVTWVRKYYDSNK